MPATPTFQVPERLRNVFTLARLLAAMESSADMDAAQYRHVAARLSEVLGDTGPDEALHSLLSAFPSAADIYENLRYEQAGLCLRPLEASMNSEIQARDLLTRLQKQTPAR